MATSVTDSPKWSKLPLGNKHNRMNLLSRRPLQMMLIPQNEELTPSVTNIGTVTANVKAQKLLLGSIRNALPIRLLPAGVTAKHSIDSLGNKS